MVDYPMQMGDYPSQEDLKRIRAWPYDDLEGLMAFIAPYWVRYGTMRREGNGYALATGGWSGNEDIIGAIRENAMFSALYYARWERGGLHVFFPRADELAPLTTETPGVTVEGYVREGECPHPKLPGPNDAYTGHGVGCIWQCRCGEQFRLSATWHSPITAGSKGWNEYQWEAVPKPLAPASQAGG